MRGAGTNLKVVQRQPGHSSGAITLEAHSHVLPSDMKDTVETVAALMVPTAQNADILRT